MANITTTNQKFSIAIKSDRYIKLINDTLGDKKVALQFIADISAVVATNSSLQKCEAGSIVSGALLAHSLKLPLASAFGFAYLVPYQVYDKATNSKVYKAQFQMGYKGYIQLAVRTNQYRIIDATAVYKDEYKGRDPHFGTPLIEFTSKDHTAEKPIGYVAFFQTTQGFSQSIFMTASEVEAHAKRYSKAYLSEKKDSPWFNNFEAMAEKTVLKKLISKYGIMSVEYADPLLKAIEADQAVIGMDGKKEYIDNDFEEPENAEEVPEEVAADADDKDEDVSAEAPTGPNF